MQQTNNVVEGYTKNTFSTYIWRQTEMNSRKIHFRFCTVQWQGTGVIKIKKINKLNLYL
jgi:hypothetical protein